MSSRRLEVLAPAKVNLYLGVGARREDGYHDVLTIMHTLALADTLVVESVSRPASGAASPIDASDTVAAADFLLVATPPFSIPVEENLITRAARGLAAALGRPLVPEGDSLHVSVVKRIPQQAGLGGGSSDAAAMIVALCRLWQVDVDDARVVALARSLGADVPFFLQGGCALFDDRGDHLVTRFEPLGLPVVIANGTGVGVSTAAAYRAFDADPRPRAALADIEEALEADVDAPRLAGLLHNNLETAARSVSPRLGDHLDRLSVCEGVCGACLSGSGSAAFALCATSGEAEKAAAQMADAGFQALATSFAPRGATVVSDRTIR